jgi:FdhD protein
MTKGLTKTEYRQYRNGTSQHVEGAVPAEERIVLFANGLEMVALMCTPILLRELALGFLYNEGLISGSEEVFDARICGSGRCVDIWLNKDIDMPTLRTITTGCSGGTTFEALVDVHRPLTSDLTVSPQQVTDLMGALQQSASLYRQAHGIHTSALADGSELVCVAEDVGRHNTVDKLCGIGLLSSLPTENRILLTTGRVSSEMLAKSARMGVPVVISHTSPTSISVELARAWNITLIGYARGKGFRCYAGQDRLSD